MSEPIGAAWAESSAPCPTVEQMYRAQRSPLAREETDRAYAAWLGLPPDEVGPFLVRLKLYDLRHAQRVEREAIEELRAAREERVGLMRDAA